MANLTSLQTLDYIIVAVVAVLFLGIGFYFACLGGKQRTTREYFKGDGNMNVIPIYIECRFNRTLRVSVGLMYIFSMIVYASFFIYAPALALSQVLAIL
uniref:Uncharacterized protein n=1 Tax=Strigamia maritima TaxID=126957 RepID=T1ILQ7_STRMM